jgi:hypothetical protein
LNRKKWMVGVCAVAVAVLLLLMPRAAYAGEEDIAAAQQAEAVEPEVPVYEDVADTTPQGEEGIYVMESTVILDTEIRELPLETSNAVGFLRAGSAVSVFQTGVAQSWNAIVLESGEIRYVPGHAVELTAGRYVYEQGADMTRITNFGAEELERALAGTGLAGLGAAYAQMEKDYGINALFLIAIAKLESAGGSSGLAVRQNNLGGLKNGGSGYMSFDTKEDCIVYMAQLLKENYLTEGAKHYFGRTAQDVNRHYCEGSAWSGQVESLMSSSYQAIAAA